MIQLVPTAPEGPCPMQASAIVHVLKGRIRLQVPSIDQAPAQARRLEQRLCEVPGILDARANPTTGNVLIRFDPDVIDVEHILRLLHYSGPAQSTPATTSGVGQTARTLRLPRTQAPNRLVEVVLWKAAEIAAERLLLALI